MLAPQYFVTEEEVTYEDLLRLGIDFSAREGKSLIYDSWENECSPNSFKL
jgi:hypothetical protein